jgi:hypothetical protein
MRDLLNLLDVLQESRGLSARAAGEVYSRGDTSDDKITFQELAFYPEVGSYETTEEMLAALAQIEKEEKTTSQILKEQAVISTITTKIEDTEISKQSQVDQSKAEKSIIQKQEKITPSKSPKDNKTVISTIITEIEDTEIYKNFPRDKNHPDPFGEIIT